MSLFMLASFVSIILLVAQILKCCVFLFTFDDITDLKFSKKLKDIGISN